MEGVANHNHGVVKQQLLDVDIGSGHKLGPSHVAGGQVGGLVEGVGDDEDFLGLGDGADPLDSGAG